MKRLLEDGLIYYTCVLAFFVFGMEDDEKCSAIFAVTLVLTIMIVAAPPGIKNITAQYALLFGFLLFFTKCTIRLELL